MTILGLLLLTVIVYSLTVYIPGKNKISPIPTVPKNKEITQNLNPLSIQAMREKSYPGSDIVIEETLSSGSNYSRYIASYRSEGLKIYALLTVPEGPVPQGGFPVILFNHGYIPPNQYSTANSYNLLVDPLASSGYIVFKPDYRGNGNSQGQPTQVYVSPDYVTDSLNALSSIKRFKNANPNKIGVWGHSMGGNITLRDLVVSKDFRAAVIWSGVVGSYSDILDWWNTRVATGVLTTQNDLETAQLVQQLVKDHGTPQSNPNFWNPIDPTNYISDINAPMQIDVGTADQTVPPSFSTSLKDKLDKAGKTVEFYSYPGADHNLSPDSSIAMQHSIDFFNKYLK